MQVLNKISEKEVRLYTDLPIVQISSPFPINHLYAVRNKHSEHAELTNVVLVYVKPKNRKP